MSRMRLPQHLLTLLALAVATLVLVATGRALPSVGSSHRDAPLITEDPTADNTDVYAFTSTEAGRSNYVTLIANYIPFEEPTEGPNYYRFSDTALYEIHVSLNGNMQSDLTYQLRFSHQYVTSGTVLYNTGKIGLPPNPADPTSQYTNLNLQQSYTLTEIAGGCTGPDCSRGGATSTVLLNNARVAPWNIGPKSTGTQGEYDALAAAAVLNAPNGIKVFAGPRAEGFYVDLMGAFDLLNPRNPGVNSTAGFNVHTIALEIPKSRFTALGNTNSIIGVWASASRSSVAVLRPTAVNALCILRIVAGLPSTAACPDLSSSGPWAQVSRLGNPLVNELLIPVNAKDQYNATQPVNDGATFHDYIVNPGMSQGAASTISLLNSLTGGCTAVTGRADLQAILLTGIPPGLVPGFAGNYTGPTQADVERLNFSIAPSAEPSSLGLLGGDPAGYPNGRRVFDDTVDITLKAGGGVLQPLVGLPACPGAANLTDNVNGPSVPYLTVFPYLASPIQGYGETN